jgi:hypothetical protein
MSCDQAGFSLRFEHHFGDFYHKVCDNWGDDLEIIGVAMKIPFTFLMTLVLLSCNLLLPDNSVKDRTPDPSDLTETSTATITPTEIPGQNEPPTPDLTAANSTWIRAYGSENWIKAGSIVAAQDGYYVAGFVTNDPSHLFVLKLDQNQEVLWQYQYGFDCGDGIGANDWRDILNPSMFQVNSNLFSTTLTANSDGGVIVAFDWYVIRLDAQGREVWSANYRPKLPDPFSITSIVEVADGYLMAGNFAFEMFTDLHPDEVFLIKTNLQGELQWARHYAGSGGIKVGSIGTRNESYKTVQIHLTPDSQNIILGTYTMLQAGVTHYRNTAGLVMKLGLDGSIFWSRAIEIGQLDDSGRTTDATLHAWDRFRALEVTRNGDILFVQGMSLNRNQRPLISRLSPDGEVLWSISIHSIDPTNQTIVTQIQEDPISGDIIYAGFSTLFEEAGSIDEYPEYEFNVVLGRLSAQGKVEWIRSIGKLRYYRGGDRQTTDIAYDFAFTPQGGILAAGTADGYVNFDNLPELMAPTHYDLLLVKADSSGYVRNVGDMVSSAAFGEKGNITVTSPLIQVTSPELQVVEEDFQSRTCRATTKFLPLQQRVFDARQPMQVSVSTDGKRMLMNQSIFVDAALDPDGDTLNQDWENIALKMVQPLLELDEEEEWLDHRDEHHVVNFVRVSPYPETANPDYILFQYAVTWSMDYGGGQEELYPIKDHRGDVELIILAWRVSTQRSLWLEWVYTAAHDVNSHAGVWHVTDPTCNRGSIADTGIVPGEDGPDPVGTELMCETLRFKNGRVFLQVSENKHALYPSTHICEFHATLVAEGGSRLWGEDCGWETSDLEEWWISYADLKDDLRYQGDGTFLFDAYNVGEPPPQYQLIDNLQLTAGWKGLTEDQTKSLIMLFPNESIWSGHYNYYENKYEPVHFCGGIDPPPEKCCGTVGNSLGPPLPQILQIKLGPTVYRVRINTANQFLAGTDSVITITLYSAENPGSQYSEVLDGSFEKNTVDIFHIGNTSNYIGAINAIGLQRDDSNTHPDLFIKGGILDVLGIDASNSTPDWFVDTVEVIDKTTGQRWFFEINMDIQDTDLHIFNVTP